jgi:hypothetical protein
LLNQHVTVHNYKYSLFPGPTAHFRTIIYITNTQFTNVSVLSRHADYGIADILAIYGNYTDPKGKEKCSLRHLIIKYVQ